MLGIVRGHDGALRVDSEPGRGTTLTLLLPCAPTDVQVSEERSPLEDVRGSGLVLIVDDEETVRTTTARMFESAGYQTVLAEDGCEGLSIFKERADEIQLVMLDLTMPHMDGVETFREIRQVRPEASVILMSGYNEQEAVRHFTGKGLAGFIQKPFTIKALLGRVREVLAKE
ncbi:MAG: response regulator [Limisphaerales bacterium]